MRFDDYRIADGVKKAIAKAGYTRPTDIQYKAIPPILRGEDVLAIAQTGTGKTAAFAIPIIHILSSSKKKGPPEGIRCLVMVPTHELARQTDQVFKSLSRNSRVRSLALHGGVSQDPQKDELEKGVDVLIATPGRLFDLNSQGSLSLERLDILVLDEADHMLDLGFIKDIRDLMHHLPKRRQTLFFSATIDEKIKKIAYSLVVNPIRIQISPKDPVARNIEHAVAFVDMDDKRFFLERMVQSDPERKILVFVRTQIRAERVKKAMERVGIAAETMHGGKGQTDRKEVMQQFHKGELKLLIATDLSARGIDIPNVDMVINYDLPENPEQYVHRVGRTGRADQKGEAVAFCSPEEVETLQEIEEGLGKPVHRLEITDNFRTETIEESKSQDQTNWQALLDEEESFVPKKKKSRKK